MDFVAIPIVSNVSLAAVGVPGTVPAYIIICTFFFILTADNG